MHVRAALAASIMSLVLQLVVALPGQAADLLRVGKPIAQSFSFALLDLGVEHGLFRKHGLEIEIDAFGGSAKMVQAMVAGSIDMCLDNGPDMAFIAKGAPTKAVAAMAGAPIDVGLAVSPTAPIATLGDLKGKKIGVSSPGALTALMTVELSRQQGWGPDGIDIVTTGSPTTSIALMKTSQIDGTTVDLGFALQAQKRGDARIVLRLGNLMPDYHTYVIVATDRLIAAQPDAVRGFLQAWFETIAFARADKDAAVASIAKTLNVDRGLVGELYDLQMSMYSSDGRFKPKALAALRRSFVDSGVLKTEPDMAPLYTEAFLPGH
jgi:NitT/TauT family transport system substrate-binding protein